MTTVHHRLLLALCCGFSFIPTPSRCIQFELDFHSKDQNYGNDNGIGNDDVVCTFDRVVTATTTDTSLATLSTINFKDIDIWTGLYSGTNSNEPPVAKKKWTAVDFEEALSGLSVE